MLEHSTLLRIINGCLRNTIHCHGDITKERIGSASKRICGQIIATVKQKEEQSKQKEICIK